MTLSRQNHGPGSWFCNVVDVEKKRSLSLAFINASISAFYVKFVRSKPGQRQEKLHFQRVLCNAREFWKLYLQFVPSFPARSSNLKHQKDNNSTDQKLPDRSTLFPFSKISKIYHLPRNWLIYFLPSLKWNKERAFFSVQENPKSLFEKRV